MKFLSLLLLAAAPVVAQQNCTYTIDPLSFVIGPDPVPETRINVTTQTGCAWTPAIPASVSWLHVGIVSSPSGSGFMTWTADRNPTINTRAGAIVIAGQVVAITQTAATCPLTLTPTAATVPAEGGPGSAAVTAVCNWATQATTWITIGQPNSGTGNAVLSYTVAPNTWSNSRVGQLVVALPNSGMSPQYRATLTITQSGSPTGLTTIPTSLSLPAAVTDGRITIVTPPGCTWSAMSNVSWLQLQNPVSGTGSADLSYHAPANNGATRTGTITIGTVTIAVTQAGGAVPAVQITTVTNAASYTGDAVSPGEIVSLFGTSLGPTPAVPLQLNGDGTAITKTLGGVQVLFDGVAAPLTYVSAKQINAIVPYGVAGKASTNIQVQNQTGSSAVVTMNVNAVSPGLFTQDGSGLGPGAILNQDYQLNGSAARAARGDAIMIYLTGTGVTNPPSADGSVTGSDPPSVAQPVSVTIGGVDAPVLYSGAAPGAVAGLTQVNVRVPDGATGILPIVVKAGSGQTQAGVTVAVK